MTMEGDRIKAAAIAAQKTEQARSIALPPKPRATLAGAGRRDQTMFGCINRGNYASAISASDYPAGFGVWPSIFSDVATAATTPYWVSAQTRKGMT